MIITAKLELLDGIDALTLLKFFTNYIVVFGFPARKQNTSYHLQAIIQALLCDSFWLEHMVGELVKKWIIHNQKVNSAELVAGNQNHLKEAAYETLLQVILVKIDHQEVS